MTERGRDGMTLVGPFCAECWADTKGDPACYVPAPKQGGPFHYCHACRPPVNFLAPATNQSRTEDPT